MNKLLAITGAVCLTVVLGVFDVQARGGSGGSATGGSQSGGSAKGGSLPGGSATGKSIARPPH
jgi:hypothetical protein